ncbi:MAG: acetyl-CoA hydrolase/transferase C-terminal domain-containing protein [Streptosporangiaceae bacterium]
MHSAVEVDLFGQLNSELAGGRYVGAVGGQADSFRAAHRSDGGLAIVALASASPSVESRIVPRFGHGMVTWLKSDVDVIVTEWGIANIGACSMRERVERWRRWRTPITGKRRRPASGLAVTQTETASPGWPWAPNTMRAKNRNLYRLF